MSYELDLCSYLKKENPAPEFVFNGKTYKIKKDYRVSIAMQGSLKKNKDADPAEYVKAFEAFFIEAVGKDFLEEVRKADVSEDEFAFLFKYIQFRRANLTHEDAMEEARKANDTTDDTKKK